MLRETRTNRVENYGWKARSLQAILWGIAMYAALAVVNVQGEWGRSLCGPWGCLPPLQALLACHLAWLVGLTPPVLMSSHRLQARKNRCLGWSLIAGGSLGFAVLATDAAADWLQLTNGETRYLGRHVLLTCLAYIDLPLAEAMALGTFVLFRRSGASRQIGQVPVPVGTLRPPVADEISAVASPRPMVPRSS